MLVLYHEFDDESDAHWKLELSVTSDVGTAVGMSLVVVLALPLMDSDAEGIGRTESVARDVVLAA